MPLFLYLLLLAGYIFSRGFFSVNSEIIMLVSLLLFFLLFIFKFPPLTNLFTAGSVLFLECILSITLYGGLYQTNIGLILISYFLLILNLILTLKLINDRNDRTRINTFIFIIITLFLLRVFMVLSSPKPYIDIFDFLQKGALGLLHGKNPYQLIYTKFYSNFTPDYYSYLPGMLFFTLPFVAVTSDPRYTFVVAEIISALIIWKLTTPKKDSLVFPLIVLNNPMSLFLIEQSYIEPLTLCLFMFTAYFYMKKKNIPLSMTFGLMLATKQYMPFIIPAFYKLISVFKQKISILLGVILTAIIITLPFFLWSPKDFIKDTVDLYINVKPRYEGLSFFSLLRLFGIDYNIFLSFFLMLIFPSLVFFFQRKYNGLSLYFYISSFCFLVFFYFNKQAFVNYYYLTSQLLLAGIAFEA